MSDADAIEAITAQIAAVARAKRRLYESRPAMDYRLAVLRLRLLTESAQNGGSCDMETVRCE